MIIIFRFISSIGCLSSILFCLLVAVAFKLLVPSWDIQWGDLMIGAVVAGGMFWIGDKVIK